LLTSGRDDVLRLVDVRSHQTRLALTNESYRTGINWGRACFSPDGQYVCAGGADGSVFIWNANTGSTERVLKKAHSALVSCVGWSANGHQIVSCDRTGNIVLWDS